MKQKWINTRMSMLGKLLPDHGNKKSKEVATEFLKRLKLEYNQKPSLSYEGGDAIPLKDSDVYASSIPLGQKDVLDEVIQMKDREE